jgi:hypothetical protein
MSAVESLLQLHGGNDHGVPVRAATEQQPRNPTLPELQRLTIEERSHRRLSTGNASQVHPQPENVWDQSQPDISVGSISSTSSNFGSFDTATSRAASTGSGELRVGYMLPNLHARRQSSSSNTAISSGSNAGTTSTTSSKDSTTTTSGRNNSRSGRYLSAPPNVSSSQFAPSTLFDTIGATFAESRMRRESQDGSEGGAPSAEVTDDENESEDESSARLNVSNLRRACRFKVALLVLFSSESVPCVPMASQHPCSRLGVPS